MLLSLLGLRAPWDIVVMVSFAWLVASAVFLGIQIIISVRKRRSRGNGI